MPEYVDRRFVQVLTDLHISVSSDRGDATAHLHGGLEDLVLDVDRPGLWLGELRHHSAAAPAALVDAMRDRPVHVRSRDRDLGSYRLTRAGKIRGRPTAAGLIAILGVLGSEALPRRAAATGGVVLLAAAVAVGVHRRLSLREP